MTDAFTTPTLKIKDVIKSKRKVCNAKNDKHASKKNYTEGFTPPDPSSKESGSEASMHDSFKNEENPSDDEMCTKFDNNMCVR